MRDFRAGGDVPGKRQRVVHDTVPAVLAPREAVLTPGAADDIGRDKIARANARSNHASGLDKAMMDHADNLHPVKRR